MRIGRRAVLGGGVAAALGLGGATAYRALAPRPGSDAPEAIEVRAAPIPAFRRGGGPDERRFGALAFRSGLVLSSQNGGFGGLSGLWVGPGGDSLVAISDAAQWLTASIDRTGGRLAGLSGASLAPVLGAGGEPLRRGAAYDTEALAIADGVAYVGIERVHQIRRFAWARDGVRARGEPLPLQPEIAGLPANRSLEAVAVAPPGHPLAGALLAIAEEARKGADAPTRGWVVTGPARFSFDVARSDDFDITDAAFLPSGELLLLERRFTPLRGVACRVRRVDGDAIRPGATLDGPVLLEADGSFEIDNMEGLAVHRDPSSGETVLTLVSDDNFSPVQRTVLLEFTLAG